MMLTKRQWDVEFLSVSDTLFPDIIWFLRWLYILIYIHIYTHTYQVLYLSAHLRLEGGLNLFWKGKKQVMTRPVTSNILFKHITTYSEYSEFNHIVLMFTKFTVLWNQYYEYLTLTNIEMNILFTVLKSMGVIMSKRSCLIVVKERNMKRKVLYYFFKWIDFKKSNVN